MSKYNTVLDAIHSKMDKFIDDGLLTNSAKVLDIAGALKNLADASLEQVDAETKAAIVANNEEAKGTISDQLGIVLEVLESNLASGNPLTALTVDVEIGSSTDLLGKVVSDLQDNVEINGRKITGDINYIDDYTGFSGDVAEQSGHYIALHITVPEVTGVTIKAQTSRIVTLDADGILVLRFKDDKKYPITFIAEKEGYGTVKKTYDLSGVNLLPAENG